MIIYSNMERDQKIIYVREFLKKHNLAVVSTLHVEKSGIESAVVAFAETSDLEIIFGTSTKTRKYKNLQANKTTSFVIGWSSDVGTLQFEGESKQIPQEQINNYALLLTGKNISNAAFLQNAEQAWFIVKPNWIRLLDTTSNGVGVLELDF